MYYATEFSMAAFCHTNDNISGEINEIADVANKFAIAILPIYSVGIVVRYIPNFSLDVMTGFSHQTMLSLASPVPSEGIKT